MDSRQIIKCLKENKDIKKKFLGVFPCDKIPKRIPKKDSKFLIINTDVSTGSGIHWLVFHIDPKIKQVEVFDPASTTYTSNSDLTNYIGKLEKEGFYIWYCNQVLQSSSSNLCAVYCLMYIHHRVKGHSFFKFLQKFKTQKLEDNDRIVLKLFRSKFNCAKKTSFKKPKIVCVDKSCEVKWIK